MKKLLLILPMVLLFAGCSPKTESVGQTSSVIETMVNNIAQELGISAKVKSGKEKFFTMEYKEFTID